MSRELPSVRPAHHHRGAGLARAATGPLDHAMDRVAAGDDDALRELYALAWPSLVNRLIRLVRHRSAAEDLAQDTMVRVHAARGQWSPGARFLPWAQAIARRLFLDRARRHQRERRYCDSLAWHGGPVGPVGADLLGARRELAGLAAAFDTLPAPQRDALRLVALEGRSLADAAAHTGDSNGALRVRIHRARRSLASAIGRHR